MLLLESHQRPGHFAEGRDIKLMTPPEVVHLESARPVGLHQAAQMHIVLTLLEQILAQASGSVGMEEHLPVGSDHTKPERRRKHWADNRGKPAFDSDHQIVRVNGKNRRVVPTVPGIYWLQPEL